MSVYIDDMRRPARPTRYRGRGTPRWSHLMADTTEELRVFARRLGLDPSWLQHEGGILEHYDVTDTVRTKALQMGAVPIRYGREGGLLSMLKRARRDGDMAAVADVQARLAEIGSVIVAEVSS